MRRRTFMKAGMMCGVTALVGRRGMAQEGVPGVKDLVVPLRQVTKGPGFHWFGYYDKLQFDPTSRFALGMRTMIDKRTPEKDDVVEIGLIDLEDDCRWTRLGESRAWSWQQGCMLQWIPGSPTEVIWNDREGDRYVSRIVNVKTGATRTLPKAIYALSPSGDFAVGTEFSRIDSLRPGYGYVGVADPHFDVKAPKEIGVYRLDLNTGKDTLIASLGELAAIPHNGRDVTDNFHWFNHLLVNTDGTRLTFLHRWRKERGDRQKMQGGWSTRMFTLGTDGRDLHLLTTGVSHFVWSDATHIAAFIWRDEIKAMKLYLIEDKTGNLTPVGHGPGKIEVDGHNTFIPGKGNRWILNDTYPQGPERLQTLYLYDTLNDKRFDLGRFHEPREFSGEWRVDLHARNAPNGKRVIFDSSHSGERQMWMLDLSGFQF